MPTLTREWTSASYTWVVPTSYVLGRMVLGGKKKDIDSKVFGILLALGSGMYLQALLNYGMIKFGNAEVWSGPAFWVREQVGSRNTWDIGFSVFLGALFYAIIVRKEKKRFFIFTVVASLVAVAVGLSFQGRTLPLLVVLSSLIMFVLYIANGHKELIGKYKKVILAVLGSAIGIAVVIVLLLKFNVAGLHDIYKDSFLNRDGGIIHNVRFEAWVGAFKNILILQKGGWRLDVDRYGIWNAHNSWLEYGQNYDIVVFSFIALFVSIAVVYDIYVLMKHSNNYKVIYMAFGVRIPLFILGMLNPDFYRVRDLMVIYVFTSGLMSGIDEAASVGDYDLINSKPSRNPYRFAIVGCGYITLALLAAAYTDWWKDRLWLTNCLIIPTFFYYLGTALCGKFLKNISIILVSLLSTFGMVYYIKTDIYISIAFGIVPIAVVLGYVLYKLRISTILVGVMSTVVSLVAMWTTITDGRLSVMKKGMQLLCYSEPYIRWVNHQLNVDEIWTAHNIVLEFARDYGLFPFVLIGALMIWTLICLVRRIVVSEKTYADYVAITATVPFLLLFTFSEIAYTTRYVFMIGLFVFGLVTNDSKKDEASDTYKFYLGKGSYYIAEDK